MPNEIKGASLASECRSDFSLVFRPFVPRSVLSFAEEQGKTIAICILKAYRGLGASAIDDVIFLKVVTKIDRIDSGAR